jgi:hypothetical protein
LVPIRKQPGLKAGAFSPALLVPVATTGTNEPYKLGLMAFFPPVRQKFCPHLKNNNTKIRMVKIKHHMIIVTSSTNKYYLGSKYKSFKKAN